MMKLTLCTTLIALTFTAGSAHTDAPASRAIQREVQSDYSRFTTAETSRKYDRLKQTIAAICSPSFQLYTPSGKVLNYAEFSEEMKATIGETLAVRENSFHPLSLRRQGNTLSETGIYVFSRTALDPDADFGTKGLTHQVSERTNYRSQWIKSGRRWQLQSLHLLARQQIVDGKPR